MNKLLSRISKGLLGLSLAFGVGVALANHRKATDVKAEGVTTLAGITSGTQYYICATVSSVDYYWKAGGGINVGTGLTGTSTTDQSEAAVVTLIGSGSTWAIQLSNGNYLTLASSKANGKYNVVAEQANWTVTEANNLLNFKINGYCLQKNSSTSLNFGSYASGQKDVWLLEAGSGPTPTTKYSVIFNANGTGVTGMPSNLTDQLGSVSLSGVSSPSREGYTFVGWSLTTDGATVNSVTVSNADVNVYAIWEEITSGDGSFEKVTSISKGDNVIFVCESQSKELTSISSTSTKYGIGSTYSGSPSGSYVFEVVEGSSSETFAFKNDTSYLYWTTGNSLALNTTLNANTSWNVSFNENDNAVITNAADSTRQIWWNDGSPRFACYTGKTESTSGYSPIQIYKESGGETLGTLVIKNTSSETSPFSINYNASMTFKAYDADSSDQKAATFTVSDATVVSLVDNGNNSVTLTGLKAGTSNLYANFEGYKQATAVINVSVGTLSSITVTGSMIKTSYSVGESWNAGGLVATATYSSGYSYDASGDVAWTYNPSAPALGVTSVVATATLDSVSGSSASIDVTVTRSNPIQVLYTQSSGASVDVYGYYVGFLDGTGPVIMDGEYGIVVYNKTADVSSYTEKETILHVTGSISIYNGLYEIGSASISVASGTFDEPAQPVTYAAKGGETADYASRLTTVSGVPTVTKGSFDSDAGTADITMSFAVGSKTVQVFYKKAAQTADATAFAEIKDAVANSSEITVKGFTGWYNGFQVQMNGVVEAVESYTAEIFSQDLLDQTDAVCVNFEDGVSDYSEFKTLLTAIWSNLASNDKYPSLPADQKTILAEADRDESGSVVEQAMARYDYLTGKYELSNFINGRTPIAVQHSNLQLAASNSDSSTMIVIIVALISVSSLTALIVIKRRKVQL